MRKPLLGRVIFVVPVLVLLGLVLGLVAGHAMTGREDRFTAQATLAMLPQREIPLEEASSFWEVLNRGQATGSAAVVLNDGSWLEGAGQAAGVPKSELTLSAGAVPDTTLITVAMTAQSARAAEVALESVLAEATGRAAAISGPFTLETITPPSGSAVAMGPTPIQMYAALGLAGLLAGAGVGVLICRSVRRRTNSRNEAVRHRHQPSVALARTHQNGLEPAHHKPVTAEIRVQ